MNRILSRIGLGLFLLLVITYLLFQISRGIGNPYTVEVALSYVASDSAPANCVLIRSETVLDRGGGGVIEHLYPDGQKVGKNDTVAYIYTSEDQVRNKARISDLQKEIEVLQNSGYLSSTGLIQADLLAKRISQQMSELTGALGRGNAAAADDVKYDLQVSLNKKKVITDGQADYSRQLEALQQELAVLERTAVDAAASILTPVSGYYVGSVDGYETLLTKESLETLTLDTVQEVLNRKDEAENTRSSKVVSDLTWYCAAIGSMEEAQRLYAGMSVDIVFPFSDREVPGTLVSFQEYPEEDKLLMVFSCTNMSEDLASVRKTTAEITFRSYSGIRVRQEAIRFDENNTEGVYVRVGEKVVFKKLDVVHRGEGYVLSRERDSSEGRYLKLFDEIIVEGKDLYDGKILQQ